MLAEQLMMKNVARWGWCVAVVGGALALAACDAPTSRARSAGELLNEADPAVPGGRSPVRALSEAERATATQVPQASASVLAAPSVQPAAEAPVAPAERAAMVPAKDRVSRIELAGKEVFEAGSWVLTPTAVELLRQQMSRLPRDKSVTIEVFNQPAAASVQRSGKPLRDLSEVRAEKLAEYLRSAEGGSWVIERAVGRGADEVDGRAADRRVEIFVVE